MKRGDNLAEWLTGNAVRRVTVVSSAILAMALLLTGGCATRDKNVPQSLSANRPTVETFSDPAVLAAKYLERFTSGEMTVKQAWDLASAFINGGNFTDAHSTLKDLRAQTGLTEEQIVAINETMEAVRKAMKAQPAQQ